MNSIYEKAKKNVKTIAIPEVTNEYMIKAAAKATADGIANIILVGNPADVTVTAEKVGVDVSGIRVVDVNDTANKEELLDRYNNSPDKAMPTSFVKKRIDHPLYLATLLQAVGEADGTLAGVDTTTYEFVLAAKKYHRNAAKLSNSFRTSH